MAAEGNGRDSNKFFTPKEAAAYIGVTPETFRGWLRKNKKKIPMRRFGRNCIRIPKDKFIEWANA